MEEGLLLHPEKGVNPRLTTCARCGGEGRGLILLGKFDYKDVCNSCKTIHYGGANRDPRTNRRACNNCGSEVFTRQSIDEHEKIPHGLCHFCEKEVALHKKLVEEGGVYWRCRDCKASGVIKDSPFTKLVRENLNIEAPQPCGIEFSKSGNDVNCPVCGDRNPECATDSEKD